MIVAKEVLHAYRAGDVVSLRRDVVPGVDGRLKALAVAGRSIPLDQAVDAGQHLVGLAVAHLVDALSGREA